jgi:ABC-2 type transport system ATP-binding protein
MEEAALRFERVAKAYRGAPALLDFSLAVRRGECIALVGVNGAGKTTLIKCLLDFCDADAGSMAIFGLAHHEPRARARLAYLPERFNPPHYLTGRDFLRYMHELYGIAFEEERIAGTFAALDLERSALDRPARTYSKGMTQKLGLAACLLSGRELYVLDEPAGGLDPKARALFKRELRARHRGGSTVFFTSHALGDVGELCDRVAVLHEGRLRFAGAPAELVRRHAPAADLEQAFLDCIAAPAPAGT